MGGCGVFACSMNRKGDLQSLVWYDEEWKRIFGGRGDGAGSGRVLELRRGGWDVVVG